MKYVWMLALALSACALSHAATRAIVLAGQSNAVGVGDARKINLAPYKTDGKVKCFWKIGSGGFDRWRYASDGWEELSSQRYKKMNRFGPEITLGKELLDKTGEPWAIIKIAYGGAALADLGPNSWAPARSVPCLYSDFLGALDTAVASWRQQHEEDLEIAAFFWFQGEGDTVSPAPAQAYAQNLSAFIDRVRRDLQNPDLPVIVADIRIQKPEQRAQSARKVNEAIAAVVQSGHKMAHISTADLEQMPDGVHFTGKSLLEIGRRMADAFFKIRN